MPSLIMRPARLIGTMEYSRSKVVAFEHGYSGAVGPVEREKKKRRKEARKESSRCVVGSYLGSGSRHGP
jgi:hypothetical protein